MEKNAIRGKRRARRLLLQALYQWLMSGHEISEIETQFRVNHDMDKVDADYFCKLLYGIPKSLQVIEENFSPFLDIPINSLNPIELTILRLSTYELLFCLEIPYRVVLDEAVSLAKEYGAQDGHRFVNGVLNKLAKQVRSAEINLNYE
ncbi:transcription antitermination factor NusB [Legionella sp. D16C41]|uniref:transcription antitermination factor NusB n=1 Tax=Legionella sp. D16C41 TaxID=3402688 RepID=UPI003AF56B93